MTKKKPEKPWPYFFERVCHNGKLCLAICKTVAVKIMPEDSEEDWHKAVAELDRMNEEYRKEMEK